MKVILAEKPSVARDIAKIVGATTRKDGYIQGNDYAVTWAFGHLVGLALPNEYGIESFQRQNLPILPEEFKLIPRQVKEGKEWKSDAGALKQLNVIKELFNSCESIVVATDAGREGELIFRYIYNYLGCRKPFSRLWISSLTDIAITNGLASLKDGKQYDNLYYSAKARSEADWLIGINASQALCISAGKGSFSLGRVQTPTLSMICSRYLENKGFSPSNFYQIRLTLEKDGVSFPVTSTNKYDSPQEAEKVLQTFSSMKSIEVAKVEKKEVNQEPPLLYDLTTLQKDMNRKFGFSADTTLSIAQKLYEAKLITYPRTGSRYISEDIVKEIYPLSTVLFDHPVFGFQAAGVHNSELNLRSVDDGKVTDHHALLITMNSAENLNPDELTVYDHIAGRMIESFSHKSIKEVTTVIFTVGEISFQAKSTKVKSAGWRKVFNEKEEVEEDETKLPKLSEKEEVTIDKYESLEKQTKPRPQHTESSLLSSMETAGRELENEEERAAMKESGIGTPATRAAIIETLITRGFITRDKKKLVPTEKGMTVYEIVKTKKIANVAMTGGWENSLSKIESGELDAASFHREIEVYATQITTELLETKVTVSDGETLKCPKCGEEKVVIYPKVAKCLSPDCGFIIFRNKSEKQLSDKQLTELILKRKTGLIKGFKKKDGGTFDCGLVLGNDFKVTFDFSSNTPSKKKRK